MKVLFLQDKGINESLALCDVSALLKANHHICDILIEKNERNFINSIKTFSPNLIVVPWDVGANAWACRIAKMLKANFNVPTVFCGTYPTFQPEEVFKNQDIEIICIGECEYALLDLVNRLENNESIKEIHNIWARENGKVYKNELRPLIPNLDELPLPDRAIYYKYKYLKNMSLKRFTSGRGCHNSCSHCYNSIFKQIYKGKGRYIRRKSVERMILEIQEMKKNYPLSSIHFSDDIFTNDKGWVLSFCERYKKTFKIPFTCNTIVNDIDEEMIIAMKEANCVGIAIGLETGNENIRINILNKPFTNRKIIEVARLIKKHGIYLVTFNMIAIPTETLQDAFKTVELNRRIDVDHTRVFCVVPIPGTPLFNIAKNSGFLGSNSEIRDKKFIQKPMLKSKYNMHFKNLFHLFYIAVKYPTLVNIIKMILNFPLTPFFELLNFPQFLRERKFFNLSWITAITYYVYGGNPAERTKNFNNYIP